MLFMCCLLYTSGLSSPVASVSDSLHLAVYENWYNWATQWATTLPRWLCSSVTSWFEMSNTGTEFRISVQTHYLELEPACLIHFGSLATWNCTVWDNVSPSTNRQSICYLVDKPRKKYYPNLKLLRKCLIKKSV